MIEINNKKINPQEFVDKWTKWALEETPATDEQVIKNVQTLYEKAGLKKPEVKVFREWEDFVNYDWYSVGSSVGSSVWSSVGSSVLSSVWSSVESSVGSSVGYSVRSSVGYSVRSSVWSSVGASVRSSVGASARSSVGAWYCADYLAFADVFAEAGVLDKEKIKELEEYKKLLETQRMAVMTEDVAYVLVAPKISTNEEGKLHSEEQEAVKWGNSGIYYLHGVEFEKELWNKVGKMTGKEILSMGNVEQRMATIKVVGMDKIFKDLNAKLLDKSERGNELYLVEDVFSQPAKFVKKTCPSTGREYVEGVDPSIQKADEAIAWQMDITPQDYTRLKLET